MVKNLSADAGDIRDTGSILRLGRSPGGGHGNPVSILDWRIPQTEESGRYRGRGLQSIGSQSRTTLNRLRTHARTYL